MVWTAPGRLPYPDGEIVYETTASLVERGSWSVDGIPFRTGEPPDRPDGSFGVDGRAPDGRRYGFFGQALSVAGIPLYLAAGLVPAATADLWRRAPRRDVFVYHHRGADADWRRMVTSFTNVWICALLAWATARWARAVGFGWRASIITGLVAVFGTFMWCYGATFMSEPLSALLLVASATSIARWRSGDGSIHAWAAGALAGFTVHAHVLNVLALPCLLGYALLPDRAHWRGGSEAAVRWRRDAGVAIGLAVLGVVLLAVSHALRFGSPLETGRFGHYAHFSAPWSALAAQLVGPGRSLLLFCPALVVGMLMWPSLWRHQRPEFWLVVALVVIRLVFVSSRSDWYGGWTPGPRYLAPLVPFLALPLAAGLDTWLRRGLAIRSLTAVYLVASVALCGWLAVHSSSEHMWILMGEFGVPEFYARSHWSWAASPFARYAVLDAPALAAWRTEGLRVALAHNKWDVAWVGALRLRFAGHPGLWRLYLLDASIAAVAGWRLVAMLRRLRTTCDDGPDQGLSEAVVPK